MSSNLTRNLEQLQLLKVNQVFLDHLWKESNAFDTTLKNFLRKYDWRRNSEEELYLVQDIFPTQVLLLLWFLFLSYWRKFLRFQSFPWRKSEA